MASADGAAAPVSPFVDLLKELLELDVALDVGTDRAYDGGAAAIQTALHSQAGITVHESIRFMLVIRGDKVSVSDVTEVTGVLKQAAQSLVAGVQMATRPQICGQTLAAEIKHVSRALIRSLVSAVKPFAEGSVLAAGEGALTQKTLDALRKALGNGLLAATGVISNMGDRMAALPTSDIAAVKRKLLALAKLMKTSAQEICDDHEMESVGILSDPVAHGCKAADGDAASGAGARLSLPIAGSESGSREGGEELSKEEQERVLKMGVAVLKNYFKGMKQVLILTDAVADKLRVAEAAGNPDASFSCLTSLDSFATSAAPLEDALIDIAAAINDVSADDIMEAAKSCYAATCALQANVNTVLSTLFTGADGTPEVTAASNELSHNLGDANELLGAVLALCSRTAAPR